MQLEEFTVKISVNRNQFQGDGRNVGIVLTILGKLNLNLIAENFCVSFSLGSRSLSFHVNVNHTGAFTTIHLINLSINILVMGIIRHL